MSVSWITFTFVGAYTVWIILFWTAKLVNCAQNKYRANKHQWKLIVSKAFVPATLTCLWKLIFQRCTLSFNFMKSKLVVFSWVGYNWIRCLYPSNLSVTECNGAHFKVGAQIFSSYSDRLEKRFKLAISHGYAGKRTWKMWHRIFPEIIFKEYLKY